MGNVSMVVRVRLAPAIAIIAWCATASVAAAQASPELPVRNVPRNCSLIGRGADYNDCLRAEQSYYDLLKEHWNDIPDKIRQTCISRYANMGMVYYYRTMETCLRVEITNARILQPEPAPTFRY